MEEMQEKNNSKEVNKFERFIKAKKEFKVDESTTYSKILQLRQALTMISPDLEGKTLNVVIQRNISGITETIKFLDPILKFKDNILKDFNEEVSKLRNEKGITDKSPKIEIDDFEEKVKELKKGKYKDAHDRFDKENKDINEYLDETDSEFKIRYVEQDMIPDNIKRGDLNIISLIMKPENW